MPREKKKESGDTSFDIFWREYPRRESKRAAQAKWKSKKLDAKALIKILTYLELAVQSAQWRKDDGQFIPMASTFLNQERWLSEPPLISDGLAPREPEAPKSAEELEGIALARIREAEKRLSNWDRRFSDHVHGKGCQDGAVCAFVDSKRPTVPGLTSQHFDDPEQEWHDENDGGAGLAWRIDN